MNDEILIKVDGVSKKFCRDLKKSLWYGMKDVASELLPFSSAKGNSSGLRPGEFWANKDISFELRRGECIGLIGRNGAGKTTLLKILNGLIKPDTGSIEIRGRIGALIALGAGFNPILTGRENIYVNASILGLTKEEVDSKIDDIIEFAEIREFIDSPVQSYSSGMQVRLGFAVATSMEPDVLILDEVLAVGDAAFRAKCYARIGSLIGKSAVIFVSHNMEQVGRMCNRALVLKAGQAVHCGDVVDGIRCYNQVAGDNTLGFEKITPPLLRASASLSETTIRSGSPLSISLDWESAEKIPSAHLKIMIYDQSSNIVAEWNNVNAAIDFPVDPGPGAVTIQFPAVHLMAGDYTIGMGIADQKGISPYFWSYRNMKLSVEGGLPCLGAYTIPATLQVAATA